MWVYILQSKKIKRNYTGYTENLEKRLNWHNKGLTKSTKFGIPWEIIYKEKLPNKIQAIRRERKIKSYKGGNGFKKLLGGVA
ncbi:MAG TPA: GIY-YIG nuclease family protein [Patescibacteria group bacterium]|nr:GIY-YIG nuclease family protein [Patescibacteria group bacterium]